MGSDRVPSGPDGKQGNGSAKLLLSGILAATPISVLRDLPRALTLADSLEHDYKIDPSFWEIRAAANASRGDFKAAIKEFEGGE